MFGSIGGPELILIFLVALLIFGPRKLPELGRMLGKGLGEFRRAANDLKVSLEPEVERESPSRQTAGGAGPKPLPAPGALERSSSGPPGDDVDAAMIGSEGVSPLAPSDAPAPGGARAVSESSDARDTTGTH